MKTKYILKNSVLSLLIATSAAFAEESKDSKVQGSIPAKGDELITALSSKAKITYKQAITAASKDEEGTLVKVELEAEDGFLVWTVEFANKDGKIHEYLVDAGDGKVLEKEIETPGQPGKD